VERNRETLMQVAEDLAGDHTMAIEGDVAARNTYDEHRLAETSKGGGGAHRPSMGQDMVKGRRTEIEYLNGFVVDKGATIGIDAPANAALTDIVKRVERGEAKPSPELIRGLRLN